MDPRIDHFYQNVRDAESDAYQFTVNLYHRYDTDAIPTIDADVVGDVVCAA